MGKVEVHNTKRLPEGTVYHIGTVVEGSISEGDDVTLEVDTKSAVLLWLVTIQQHICYMRH